MKKLSLVVAAISLSISACVWASDTSTGYVGSTTKPALSLNTKSTKAVGSAAFNAPTVITITNAAMDSITVTVPNSDFIPSRVASNRNFYISNVYYSLSPTVMLYDIQGRLLFGGQVCSYARLTVFPNYAVNVDSTACL